MLFATFLWITSAFFALLGLGYLLLGRKALELEVGLYEKLPRAIVVLLYLILAAVGAACAYGGITTPLLDAGWRFDLIACGGMATIGALVFAFTLRGPIREHFAVKPWLGFHDVSLRFAGLGMLIVAYALDLIARTIHSFE